MRPPQHRIDAPILFVQDSDPAIDKERIAKECKELEAAGHDPADHPWRRYARGETRFDLDAEVDFGGLIGTVRDYIGEGATIWTLARLGFRDWPKVESKFRRYARMGEDPLDAYVDAAICGVESVDGLDLKIERFNGRLTEATCEAIQAHDPELLSELGAAVYLSSMQLREDEKKR